MASYNYNSHRSLAPEDQPSDVSSSSQKQPPLLCIHQKSRKRQRSTKEKHEHDGTTTLTLSHHLRAFQHSPHSLRISASSVAALCGLHPYQNLPQLFFDLVYQSHLGQLLLQNDTSLLGLQLVEDAKTYEREQLLAMASSISHETKELVQTSLAVSDGTTKLQSVEDVQSIQRQIRTNAMQSDKLTRKQVESLVDASRQNLATGFGTSHEEDALDVYEGVVGCRVRERNEALMTWKFERVQKSNEEDNERDGEMGGITARPIGEARRREWGDIMSLEVNNDQDDKKNDDSIAMKSEEKSEENEVEVIDIGVDDTTSSASTANIAPLSGQQRNCFFKIVGAVDGIRDEIYIDPPIMNANNVNNSAASASNTESKHDGFKSKENTPSNTHNNDNPQNSMDDEYNFSDDEDTNGQWRIRPIIVECKHRMSQAKMPPPLYDQIQTCLYMNMYNVEEADLIQVVRRSKKRTASAAVAATTAPTRIKNEEGAKGKENDQPIQKEVADTTAQCDNEVKEDNKKGEKKKEDSNIQITISRIALHDPIHNHQHHWNETLLPRLASFVDAVYNVRKDDGKRYRLLMAMVQEQNFECHDDEWSNVEAWKILWDEMPWLRTCDTAFGRRGMR
eukprot:scaffold4589_cov79-Skeletonema_menzelii.AAC.19